MLSNDGVFRLQNERDPKLKERSNSRNALLDQYCKVLPRVQRRLAMERAKPYHHPAPSHREGTRTCTPHHTPRETCSHTREITINNRLLSHSNANLSL